MRHEKSVAVITASQQRIEVPTQNAANIVLYVASIAETTSLLQQEVKVKAVETAARLEGVSVKSEGEEHGRSVTRPNGQRVLLWSITVLLLCMTEIEITANLIRDLLRNQHPDLAELPLREVEGGWGNQMWRLGDELAVRIQRMDTDPDHQLKERRWLPLLASHLPLPIPVPVRNGAPSELFPKIWTVMRWVPGLPLDHGSITRGEHAADTLAEFLRALHVPAPADAPVDTGRGAHPKDCTDGFRYFFDSVDADAIGSDAADIQAVWDDAVAAPEWEGPPVWVHGDLHPANVVVAEGTLAGVVDFGDMFVGDPALDLAAAWVLLPAGAATRFFAAYAEADEGTVRRARGLAVAKSLFLMLMGQNGDRGLPGGKPAWGPAGRAALDRVLSERLTRFHQ